MLDRPAPTQDSSSPSTSASFSVSQTTFRLKQWLPDGKMWLAALLGPPLVLLLFTAWELRRCPECSFRVLLQNQPDSESFEHMQAPITHKRECPVRYERQDLEAIRRHDEKPYLFGGTKKAPDCNHCEDATLWGRRCRYEDSMPTCYEWDHWKLIDYFVGRADTGAPGQEEMLTLTPCDVWPFLRGRTLWLVGDSITQYHMIAWQCFMQEFWNMDTTPWPTQDSDVISAVKFSSQMEPWCIEMQEGSRACHMRINHGDKMVSEVLPTFANGQLGQLGDIMVVNFGLWIHSEGEYADQLHEFADFYHQNKAKLPFVIWRDASPQHFDTDDGEYTVGGSNSDACKPLNVTLQPDNTLVADSEVMAVTVAGGWRNRLARPVMAELGIPVSMTWNQTVPLWGYRYGVNYQSLDCTHSCQPAEYQLWVYMLYSTLTGLEQHIWEHLEKLGVAPSPA